VRENIKPFLVGEGKLLKRAGPRTLNAGCVPDQRYRAWFERSRASVSAAAIRKPCDAIRA
jgi:hypothetical protein